MRILASNRPFLLYFSLMLSLMSPFIQSYADTSPAIANENNALPPVHTKRLSNGFLYLQLLADETNPQPTVILNVDIPQNAEESGIAQLLQHAVFYGTKQLNREAIIDILNRNGIDINAINCVSSNVNGQFIQLSFADSKAINEILSLVQQVAFEPALTDEGIELARQAVLSVPLNCEEEEEKQAQELLRNQITNATAAQVREFHAKWYRPDLMFLFLKGVSVEDTLIESMFAEFTAREAVPADVEVRLAQLDNQSVVLETNGDMSDALTEHIEMLIQDNKNVYVVDGKIWMNEPNWINKSSNGRVIGLVLTILGIGGMILAAPVAAPLALMGGISTITGIYFLSCGYLKDPVYVENKRHEDLQKGFAHSYRKGRLGITLTPYESRAFFLQEMSNHSNTSATPPIILLVDVYELNNPKFLMLFSTEEKDYLYRMKRDFIQQRNEYKTLVEKLNRELIEITAPYGVVRDNALTHVRDLYDQNAYVVTKKMLKNARDENIEKARLAYNKGEIPLDERDAFIEREKQYYEDAIKHPDLVNGIAAAKTQLSQLEADIQTTYQLQVTQAKLLINYDNRMAAFKQGQRVLINEFDDALRNTLSKLPLYDASLPDFVDLRTK